VTTKRKGFVVIRPEVTPELHKAVRDVFVSNHDNAGKDGIPASSDVWTTLVMGRGMLYERVAAKYQKLYRRVMPHNMDDVVTAYQSVRKQGREIALTGRRKIGRNVHPANG
jgi:hypothetical protein